MILIPLSIKKNAYSPAGSVPPRSHQASCTPFKFNIYIDTYFENIISKPLLYKFVYIPCTKPHMFIFLSLGQLSKESVQVKVS
jgi:hypothetical protein